MKADAFGQTPDRCGPIILEADAVKVRAGKETRIVIASKSAGPSSRADPKLIQLIVDAHRIQRRLLDGTSVTDLVRQQGSTSSHITKLARLAWLAPDIIGAILEGKQPVTLDRRALLEATNIPLGWVGQRAMFGFASLITQRDQ